MRKIKILALAPAVMIVMVLTSSEAAAQKSSHGYISATARVVQLLVPTAQLATAIAEMVSEPAPNRRVLPSGVYLTIMVVPAPVSTPGTIAYSPVHNPLPAKTVLIEYPAN